MFCDIRKNRYFCKLISNASENESTSRRNRLFIDVVYPLLCGERDVVPYRREEPSFLWGLVVDFCVLLIGVELFPESCAPLPV